MKNLLISSLLIFLVSCKTVVYKPVVIRAKLPIPQKMYTEKPQYIVVEKDGKTYYSLDTENAKKELKKRSAINKYIKDLLNVLKVNNDRAKKDLQRVESLNEGEKK